MGPQGTRDAGNTRSQIQNIVNEKRARRKAGWERALIVPYGDAMHRGCRLKRDGGVAMNGGREARTVLSEFAQYSAVQCCITA
jgi:hypothetical protein